MTLHHLKRVTAELPTGVLTVVTGVAGSGKSSLVCQALPARHPEAVVVDRSAIGASARSTPATYLAFMDPVTRTCEACEGCRFSDEVLAMTIRGRSVADVLELTGRAALDVLGDDPAMRPPLGALCDGLGYLAPGQAVSSLSGGERQRLKPATRLHRTGEVHVLDEPTTGSSTSARRTAERAVPAAAVRVAVNAVRITGGQILVADLSQTVRGWHASSGSQLRHSRRAWFRMLAVAFGTGSTHHSSAS